MKSLTELLVMARRHAELTGQGAEQLAPNVLEAEAHVAAWHAIAVQGGMTSPQREAWRLSADRGSVLRATADTAAYVETPVDIGLVRTAVGDAEFIQGAMSRMVVPDGALSYPEGTEWSGGRATNERGEFTGTDGKLYHLPPGGNMLRDVHEGDWLSCDGCNPVVVVVAEAHNLNQPSELEDLRGRYAVLKAAKDKAAEEFEAIKTKLQAALSEASGGATRAELRVPGYKPMTLTYTEPWTLDSKALKAEHPAVWVQYAKQGKRWTLAESRAKS